MSLGAFLLVSGILMLFGAIEDQSVPSIIASVLRGEAPGRKSQEVTTGMLTTPRDFEEARKYLDLNPGATAEAFNRLSPADQAKAEQYWREWSSRTGNPLPAWLAQARTSFGRIG